MKEFVTNDLSLTAYLIVKGCTVLHTKRMGSSYSFTLDLGDNSESKLKLDYLNSESAKFDAAVRDLKKILFSSEH